MGKNTRKRTVVTKVICPAPITTIYKLFLTNSARIIIPMFLCLSVFLFRNFFVRFQKNEYCVCLFVCLFVFTLSTRIACLCPATAAEATITTTTIFPPNVTPRCFSIYSALHRLLHHACLTRV